MSAVPGSVRQRQYLERLRAVERAERAGSQRLAVFCWCEKKIVEVPAHFVVDGRTGTCGRPRCREVA